MKKNLLSTFILFIFISKSFSQTGQVLIKTEPDEADIYINDKYIGKSPILVQKINKNTLYTIKIEKWGYEYVESNIRISEEYQELNIELKKDSHRETYPNTISFSLLGEPLVGGLEYTRYIDIPFGSVGISGGFGYWILGTAYYSTSRLILGKYNRFSPYVGVGVSVYAYSAQKTTKLKKIVESSYAAVAFYFPVGVICSVTKRFMISCEVSYWVVAGGYVEKTESGEPDVSLFKQNKSTLWGGLKFGYLF